MKFIVGFLLCIVTGWFLTLCGVPLGMMFGPLIVVMILKRWGISIRAIPGSITFIQLSLGISIGLMFRGMSFGETGSLFALLSLLCLCLFLQFITNYQWCIRHLGWSKDEAILGSVPGAMAAVLALATHINTPPQKIVISHALRLITLTMLAGFIAGGKMHPSLSLSWPDFGSTQNTIWLAGIGITGFISGKYLERWHLPAPFMMTSLICSAYFHTLAPQPLHFPDIVNQLSMGLMGILIGCHFIAFSITEFMRHLWASLQLIALSLTVTFVIAFGTSTLLGYPLYLLILSWVPGSVESMSFAALTLKADAGFVMANHIIRMLIVQTLPALALRRQKPKEAS
ncbi:AbrB family transcriptional regulator [Klebsiella sp. BIGb0407]|uniref:AbrB family transcriptional regulator n=1 Tax=Klebsiella sp. BIGb0407 TaxID=2940603 RepID=UPI00216A9FCB|nr:AbrB family transcriptional regulator [Klebsiella sp. BIGb0407]MCS3431362.1 membrane AbrB-like protein [Klebsiella sp. BIGb0407]